MGTDTVQVAIEGTHPLKLQEQATSPKGHCLLLS